MNSEKNKWHKGLEIGHDHIDNHHKELFTLTESLDKAIQSQSLEELDKLIKFLENEVFEHFKEEENIMENHNYGEILFHQEEHKQFRGQSESIRFLFHNGLSKTHLFFKIRHFIDRLLLHVRTVDIGIANLEGYHQEHHLAPQEHWTQRKKLRGTYQHQLRAHLAYVANLPPLLGFLDHQKKRCFSPIQTQK